MCWPSSGDGLTFGGLPSKRTGQAGILTLPVVGWSIVCMMPRSASEGSFISSSVSNTAPAGTPAAPMQLHRLFLGVLAGPGGDDLVDLGAALAARLLGVVARVADQILAADDLQQALPMLGIGAAAEDVDVVVRPAGLARVESRRRQPAGGRPAAAVAHRRLAGELGARRTARACSGSSHPASPPAAGGPGRSWRACRARPGC